MKLLRQVSRCFARGGESEVIRHGMALPDASRPVFVYSGNGAQWACIGAFFAKRPMRCSVRWKVDELFQRHADFSRSRPGGRTRTATACGTHRGPSARTACNPGRNHGDVAGLGAYRLLAVVGHSVGEVWQRGPVVRCHWNRL